VRVRQDDIVEIIGKKFWSISAFAIKYAESRYAPELLSLKMILRSRGKAMYEVNMASKTWKRRTIRTRCVRFHRCKVHRKKMKEQNLDSPKMSS